MGKPPKVLIFTTINWAATAQLGLALAGEVFEVATVAPSDHGYASKGDQDALSVGLVFGNASFVDWVIERWSPSIVIPCDDLAICCLHELYAQAIRGDGRDPETIKALVENSLGDPASYSVARKRSEFHGIRQRRGPPRPGDDN